MLESGYVELFAGVLSRLLADRDLASRLTEAASVAVRERFSLRTIGDEYLELYREVSGNDDSMETDSHEKISVGAGAREA